MIYPSNHFDLGQDTTRIKDPNDAERQHETVRVLLDRFFNPDPNKRWEVQIVADEVGMGKTFVALALAYSILAHLRAHGGKGDLRGCHQKVLVITPQNAALYDKWQREVSEFVNRCMAGKHRKNAQAWFSPKPVDRLDELVREIRRPEGDERVIVTHTGVLASGGKRKDYDIKRRYLLGLLFRFWSNKFPKEDRERLLRGAPEEWPTKPDELLELEEDDLTKLPFVNREEAKRALEAADQGKIAKLLETCKEIAEPYARDRAERFRKVEKALIDLYRDVSDATCAGIEEALPLVIVDEAHNWKNGPSRNTNGYDRFAELIAPRIRRALLLTATPFQLRPNEMLEILRVGEKIKPCPSSEESKSRKDRLINHCRQVIGPVLHNSEQQSRSFARAWARLPRKAVALVDEVWSSPALVRAREQLRHVAHLQGAIEEKQMTPIIEGAVTGLDPDIRGLIREALRLYTFNLDLSQELGTLVIRHRRKTDHRLVRVGSEFRLETERVMGRFDRHVLHGAPGLDVHGPGELPHYLLMRCVSEMKSHGRSSLGNALTGCYSTLLESAEGKKVQNALGKNPASKAYFELLLNMVDEKQDPEHPKVRHVTDAVLEHWRAGEKTLLFCFRSHTAKRLRQIIHERIDQELEQRRYQALGGETAFKDFRSRFSQRDTELINLGLDRVLWSYLWTESMDGAHPQNIRPQKLVLEDSEFPELARLSLRYGVNLEGERVDRIFVHRAVEHLLARRLAGERPKHPLWREILGQIADESWVSSPYGIGEHQQDGDDQKEGEDKAAFNERGVHTAYKVKKEHPGAAEVDKLAADLIERRRRAQRQGQISIFDAYTKSPSFWLGTDPEAHIHAPPGGRIPEAIRTMHRHLGELTRNDNGFDWGSRLRIFQALRRTLLRESVLLRLLPDRSERGGADWAEIVVNAIFQTLPGQSESMADRLGVYLEDLKAASGSLDDADSARHSLYEASRIKEQRYVALVDGTTEQDTRKRVFVGFNSPLLPEILICTMVGQEGIDLHRQCRHVIHYDLAWNPAVLEQRTGRVDRIGSKTFRERALSSSAGTCLEVGVPFLAGTYDERMYEELRVRAQTFEVLTGGDMSADNAEGTDEEDGAKGEERGLDYAVLPAGMLADLRVSLHVWAPRTEAPGVEPEP